MVMGEAGESVMETEKTPRATQQDVDAFIDFLGGVAGGTASVYVGQPLDTVKVKMQTFPTLYRNAFVCFKKTLFEEGLVRGLYAGTVPSLAAQVSENAILFMAYGMCQKVVQRVFGINSVLELNPVHNATAGGMAAFFSSFALCPTELIKCKLQAMSQMEGSGQLDNGLAKKVAKHHIGPWSLTQQILKTEGIPGLFRGLVPTFAREIPGYFFFFGGYEVGRHLLTPAGSTKDNLSAIRTICCGGLGGVALWVAIFPADVIKSRVQIQTGQHAKISFIAMLLKLGREEGFRALYKGLGPTVLRTIPATGALFLAFETTKKVLSDLAYND